MRCAKIVLAASVGACCSALALAGAGGGTDGAADEWTEAQSLRELPPGVQVLRGVGLAHEGIADRGDPFNDSDLRGEGLPPARRFALGLMHGGQVLVALEQGGRGHFYKAVEFRQLATIWEAQRCLSLPGLPQRGAELLELVAAPARGSACSLAGVLPAGAHAAGDEAPASTSAAAPLPLRQRPGE